jgi:hypothetical protein
MDAATERQHVRARLCANETEARALTARAELLTEQLSGVLTRLSDLLRDVREQMHRMERLP